MNAIADPQDFSHIRSSALEVETALIGACMDSGMAAQAGLAIVQPEHFQEPLNQQIWRVIGDLIAEGRPANVVTLCAAMGNQQLGENLTLSMYLSRCAADTHCPAVHVPDFARQVRELWALREVAQTSIEARQFALSPGANAKGLISDLIQNLDQTRATIESRTVQGRMIADATTAVIDRMSRKMQGEVVEACVSTGLKALDQKLGGGFQAGQLIVIGGRPGMGKTTTGVSVARQSAKKGHAGGFFSLEMPSEQISARFISDEAFSGQNSIAANQVLMGHVNDQQAERIVEASQAFADLPLALDDSSSLTVGEIGARTRSLRNRFARDGKALEFIVIDYLKFIKASERYRGQRHYEVGEISAGLKTLAKDLGIAVILLVQLNREVEKRTDKRPELADLRESGDLEADADTVLLLFREAYYEQAQKEPDLNKMQECENLLEIIVAKQRMGTTGPVKVFCHPGASALRDWTRY
jgi:replicative DNA helicase